MGQCLSLCGGGVPQIDMPAEEIATKTKELLESLPKTYEDALKELSSDYEDHKSKSPDQDFEAKTTDKKKNPLVVGKIAKGIEKDVAEKELKVLAGKVLAKGEFAAKSSEEVWTTVEPKIDEKRPENVPDFAWDKAKEAVQGKVEEEVAKQIEVAVDKLVLAKSQNV